MVLKAFAFGQVLIILGGIAKPTKADIFFAGHAGSENAAKEWIGMTAKFLHDFFPELGRFLVQQVPDLWHLLQPTHIVQGCLEAECNVPWVGRVRNPHLLLYQFLGAAIGLGGARQLLASRSPQLIYWAYSFFFFGLMNVSSIFCHAFITHKSTLWKHMSMVDVVMTGCASLCMLYQQLSTWTQLPMAVRGSLLPHLFHPPTTRQGCHALVRRTAALALTLGFVGRAGGVPWVSEVLYLGCTAAATQAVALLSWSARHTASRRQHAFYAVGLVGAMLMLSALPADRFLCRAFGPAFGTVHMLFLGCDVAYWGLYGFATGKALGLSS